MVVICLELPQPPKNLALTNIQSRSVMLQFIPGFNGYASISLWIIQAQAGSASTQQPWMTICTVTAPDANSVLVTGLTPYTSYRLQIIAKNIVGQSGPSNPTLWFDTLQAAPEVPPSDVSVRPLNETAMIVRWTVRISYSVAHSRLRYFPV